MGWGSSARQPSSQPSIQRRAASSVVTAAMIRTVNRKLVVFVPPEALDAVRDALFAAGAGGIGGDERGPRYAEGTGTFFGGEGTSPSAGEPGREERVREFRLETIF